jgi:hypothetical protein
MEPSGSSARRSGVAQKKRASTVKKGHPSKGHPSWEGVCSTLPIQRFSASVRSANTKTAGLNSNGRHRLFTHRKSSDPRLNGSVGYCSRLRLRGCNRRTRPSLSRAAGPARFSVSARPPALDLPQRIPLSPVPMPPPLWVCDRDQVALPGSIDALSRRGPSADDRAAIPSVSDIHPRSSRVEC